MSNKFIIATILNGLAIIFLAVGNITQSIQINHLERVQEQHWNLIEKQVDLDELIVDRLLEIKQ